MREVLDAAAERAETELEGEPAVRAELQQVLGSAYRGLGAYERAEAHLERALELRRRLYGAEREDVAETLAGMASLRSDQGDYDAADSLYRQALRIRERALGEKHEDIAANLNNLAPPAGAAGRLRRGGLALPRGAGDVPGAPGGGPPRRGGGDGGTWRWCSTGRATTGPPFPWPGGLWSCRGPTSARTPRSQPA